MIRFGSAGNPKGFYNSGFNKSEKMPKYLSDFELNAYEYQCTRSVKVSDDKASKIKSESLKYGIELSIHAPYYISLSTQEDDKKTNTIKYIIDTLKVAKKMGANRVVVHPGSLLSLDRRYALESACLLLKRAIKEADDLGLGNIIICPETMGKINQLGNSREIIEMCKIDERLLPTIDFGHLYCRSLGELKSELDWEEELNIYIEELGYDRMKNFHSHFSKMIYTLNGGEKCHVTFDNSECGPDFGIISKVLKKLKLEPHLICESAGSQEFDAKKMKDIYFNE